jgi:adenylate cyclase
LDRLAAINDWLMHQGRLTRENSVLLQRFCEQLRMQGINVDRCWLHNRTLRPNYAGISRLWQKDKPLTYQLLPYGFESTPGYLGSPIRFAVDDRRFHSWRLDQPGGLSFPRLEELRQDGYSAYAITPLFFSDGAVNVISWATRQPDGFSTDDLRVLEGLMANLAAVVEINSLRRFASSLLTTYVGREPGERILKGQVRRGDVLSATAAVMLADLRDFSAMSDTHSPELVIETLNRYFDCIMPPVHRRGGEVLEIMGDAMLVIFNENAARNSRDVCQRAFEAAKEGLAALHRSNAAEAATAGPDGIMLRAGFALHHGRASYGNIGSGERLDFTVIGPDINLTSRIERICREIGRELLMSANFAALLDEPAFAIGHFDLRGFARKQLLFGLN